MTYILIGTAVTAWLAMLAFAFFWWAEKGSVAGALSVFVWISISMAGALWMKAESQKRGPCLRYETGMQVNPTTKTTMPYRVCAERGEWVE